MGMGLKQIFEGPVDRSLARIPPPGRWERTTLAAATAIGFGGAILAAVGYVQVEAWMGGLAPTLVPLWLALFGTVALVGLRTFPLPVDAPRRRRGVTTISLLLPSMLVIWAAVMVSTLGR